MSLEGSDHEARVVVFVGLVRVGAVLHQVLDDVESAVEAGGAQRRRARPRRVVNVGARPHQRLHHLLPFTAFKLGPLRVRLVSKNHPFSLGFIFMGSSGFNGIGV